MTTIIERTPQRITVSMSMARWKRILKLEQAQGMPRVAKSKRHHRHETLCGIFNSGATARAEDYILVTGNTKHFERIPELQIENWMV